MRDIPEIHPVTAPEYAAIERQLATLLRTEQDCVLVQGEAILPIEAAARGLGRPGIRALNVVTGPYGATFGQWLREAGATVDELTVDFDRAVTAELVDDALRRARDVELVSIVHAEAANGIVNPLAEIAEVVRAAEALIVVDAVASVGAEPLLIDDWGLDLVIVSAQKALAGPTAVSAIVASQRAWQQLEANPAAPRRSALSLLDWKERWIDPGRQTLPVIPHHVETRLLGDVLENAQDEGLGAIVARHGLARDACRRGLAPLGLEPWVRDPSQAAAVATTLRPPASLDAQTLVDAAREASDRTLALPISAAPGPLATSALRVNHTGRYATMTHVLSSLLAIGLGLRRLGFDADIGAAIGQAAELPSNDL